MNKNRLRLWMWWVIGMWSVQSGATESALTTRVESQENGLTVSVTVDLSQLRYEPANGGSLTLPGLTPLGDWKIPGYQTELILPAGKDIDTMEVLSEGDRLVNLGLTALIKITLPSPACAAADQSKGLPALTPAGLVELGAPTIHHGVRTAILSLHPLRYAPATGQLWGVSTFTVKFIWKPGATVSAVGPKQLSGIAGRALDRLRQAALNGSEVEASRSASAGARAAALGGTGTPTYVPRTPAGRVEGILICPQSARKYYALIVEEKTRSGHPWDLVTYEWIDQQAAYQGGSFNDSASHIRAFLQEAYREYGLEYVLFGGNPPYIPSVWDRLGYAVWPSEWNSLWPVPHSTFGYYTNLDHGEQTDLIVRGQVEVKHVTFLNPAFNDPPYRLRSVITPGEWSVPGFPRCGYADWRADDPALSHALRLSKIWPAGVTSPVPVLPSVTLAAAFEGMDSAWAFDNDAYLRQQAHAHPEWWRQEMLFGARGRYTWMSTMDHEPELTAGWLPIRTDLGPVSVGLLQEKAKRYREPVDLARAATVLRGAHTNYIADFDWGGVPGLSLVVNDVRGVEEAYPLEAWRGVNFVLDDFDHCSVSRPVVDKRGSWGVGPVFQPTGLVGLYGCQSVSRGYLTGSSYESGYARYALDPDTGPAVLIHDGFDGDAFGGFHEGAGVYLDLLRSSEFLRARGSLTRLALGVDGGSLRLQPAWKTWRSGHQAMVIGDPSLRLWGAPPERPVVTHPGHATPVFGVTLKAQDGTPLAGVPVTVAKRKPDATYALYQLATTAGDGVAAFTLDHAINELGAGVLTVEAENFASMPHHDYYAYHGAMPLPVNHPPVVQVSVPLTVAVANAQGTWVIFDGVDAEDPDGDPVNLTWSWEDNRTGSLVATQTSARFLKAFLPQGPSVVNVTASDGALTSTIQVTIQVEILAVEVPVASITLEAPALAETTFSVRVLDQLGRPVAASRVQVTKYQPGGALAVKLTLSTDINGLANVSFPQPLAGYGSGLVYVDAQITIRVYDFVGRPDWFWYKEIHSHAVMTLAAGNHAPTIQLTGMRSPAIARAGELLRGFAEDTDGDRLTYAVEYVNSSGVSATLYSFDRNVLGNPISYLWQDILQTLRTGHADLSELGSYPRVLYLAEGVTVLTLRTTDGVASTTTLATLTAVLGVDGWPPQVVSPRWLIPPVTEAVTLSVMLLTGEANFSEWYRRSDANERLSSSTLIVAAWDYPHHYWEQGPISRGVAGLSLVGVEYADRPGVAPEGLDFLGGNMFRIVPEINAAYRVRVRVWDFTGNTTDYGVAVDVADIFDPVVRGRPLVLPPTGDWVPVPLQVVRPGVPSQPGALVWEAEDSIGAGVPLEPVTWWEIAGVESTDHHSPPASFRLEGTTLYIKASQNPDFTSQQWKVSITVGDRSGNTTPGLNTITVSPLIVQTFSGRVMRSEFSDGSSQSVPHLGQPNTLVEIAAPDGSWRGRTKTDPLGYWSLTAPVSLSLVRWQVGGGVYKYFWRTLMGTTLTTYSSQGLTLASKVLRNPTPPEAWFMERSNTAPTARTTGATLMVLTDEATAPVILDGSPSTDPEQDLLTYEWTWTIEDRFHSMIPSVSYRRYGPTLTADFPVGYSTVVTLRVSDGLLHHATTMMVNVRPSSPPPPQ